jgi:hypothetical protein
VEEEREGVLARGEVTGPRLPLGPERRRRGGKVLGLRAENREGEFISFFCFPFLLKQTYFKTFSKPNLNSFLIFSQNHSSQ